MSKRLPLLLYGIASIALETKASVVVPTGLKPGDAYRIIFLTTSTHNAVSSDITVYNAFVTSAALSNPDLASLNTTWTALASTYTVSVLANTGLSNLDTTTPFFNTQGNLIATGVKVPTTGLFTSGGFVTQHQTLITDENGGSPPTTFVWTGTGWTGLTDYPLGGTPGQTGEISADAGWAQSSDQNWVSSDILFDEASFLLYGVSGRLTVPTPETATLLMMSLAMTLAVLISMFLPRCLALELVRKHFRPRSGAREDAAPLQ